MNFGNFVPLRNPTAYTSSDALIYRRLNGELQVLTGIRKGDPWRNFVTVPFGGYIDPEDINPLHAAKREASEECGFAVRITRLIGIYGPERWHYKLGYDRENYTIIATKSDYPAHSLPVVAYVFAAEVEYGQLTESSEQKRLSWKRPLNLVSHHLAFDHALALAHFYEQENNAEKRRIGELALSLFQS